MNNNQPDDLELPHTASGALKPEEWVNAPVFVPSSERERSMSYAQAVTATKDKNDATEENKKKKLCPYAENDGICKYPAGECTYLHGDMCDMCGRAALHPYNEDQRKTHIQVIWYFFFIFIFFSRNRLAELKIISSD